MGCATSKPSRCRHCQSPYSPVPRSYSMHVHHPAQGKGDSYHVVALTSTTLGSLKQLHSSNQNHSPVVDHDNKKNNNSNNNNNSSESIIKEFSMGINEAKTWSDMINDKIPKIIPKTPIRTPPGEPETINTWELMEGLEDNSPAHLPNRSFSFHIIPDSKLEENNGTTSPKPQWLRMAENDSKTNSNSVVSGLDPEIMLTFRKALEELSPTNPLNLWPLECEKQESPINEQLFSRDVMNSKDLNGIIVASKCPPGGENKVVIYFTSLRGVRKTYEDCCHVRAILKGLGVRIDERDVSMHSGFRDELKELLGPEFNGVLPKVFVKGRYVGGAEEVREMHEDGELEKVVQGCEVMYVGVCEACGDVRFVPCERCSGSCKIYNDADDEEEEECEYGFQRCPDCNENGILRCPVCC
ncbi:hypothetical protein HHK36_024762 [Tetracentron sinense]|uniref:Glutaredoxin domain-containing protein n=1 Tax=Tetracentron sinense TaxID=13715 RepID=A0A834YKU7_TETSI|nr:hypothetical protein HHK36_024762 [Tetracentron sinense]